MTFDLSSRLHIVSMRVRNDGSYVVPGSAQAECDECHERVWIAPSTVKIIGHAVLRNVVLPVMCMECALPKIMADGTDADREKARTILARLGVHRKTKDEDAQT